MVDYIFLSLIVIVSVVFADLGIDAVKRALYRRRLRRAHQIPIPKEVMHSGWSDPKPVDLPEYPPPRRNGRIFNAEENTLRWERKRGQKKDPHEL